MRKKQFNIWISFISLAVLCLPDTTGYPWFDKTVRALHYASLIWPCILLFAIKHLWKRGRLVPVCVFWLVGLFNTVINRTDIIGYFDLLVSCLSVCIVTYHLFFLSGFTGIRYIGVFLTALLVLEALSVYAGGINTIVDGNGLEMAVYFLGQQPALNRIYTVSLAILSLQFRLGSKFDKWVSMIGLAAGAYSVFALNVSTAKVTLAAFLFALIAAHVIRSRRIWRSLAFFLIVFILVFTLSGGFSQGFEWLLDGLLGEDVTLHGRTLLWESALSQMNGWHWLLGNGYGHSYVFAIGEWKVGTAHNQYLNILFCFGCTGLIAYLWVISRQAAAAFKAREYHVRRILIASIIAFIVTGIPTTTYQSVYIYLLYTVAVNAHCLVQKNARINPGLFQGQPALYLKNAKRARK